MPYSKMFTFIDQGIPVSSLLEKEKRLVPVSSLWEKDKGFCCVRTKANIESIFLFWDSG